MSDQHNPPATAGTESVLTQLAILIGEPEAVCDYVGKLAYVGLACVGAAPLEKPEPDNQSEDYIAELICEVLDSNEHFSDVHVILLPGHGGMQAERIAEGVFERGNTTPVAQPTGIETLDGLLAYFELKVGLVGRDEGPEDSSDMLERALNPEPSPLPPEPPTPAPNQIGDSDLPAQDYPSPDQDSGLSALLPVKAAQRIAEHIDGQQLPPSLEESIGYWQHKNREIREEVARLHNEVSDKNDQIRAKGVTIERLASELEAERSRCDRLINIVGRITGTL